MPRPEMIRIDPHVASASRMVRIPDGWIEKHGWKLLVCKTQPHGTRGGTLLPTERGMWQVTLAEVNGNEVSRDEEGFLEFARSLPDATLYKALKGSAPISDSTSFFFIFLFLCESG